MEPDTRALADIPRRLNLVDSGLRTVFRRLVSGDLRWPLFLWGGVGTGKTLAALCLCDHVPASRYLTAEQLADAIMEKDEGEWRHLRERALVVVDELGTRENVGTLHYRALHRLTDVRERSGRVAVYISNLPMGEIAALYDDRIASRLNCGTVWKLDGDDRRLEE